MHKWSFVKGVGASSGSVLPGYGSVSKGDKKNNASQTKMFRAADCGWIFEGAASGRSHWDQSKLHRLPDHMHEGDTVPSSFGS
jgi:hypothetical protein